MGEGATPPIAKPTPPPPPPPPAVTYLFYLTIMDLGKLKSTVKPSFLWSHNSSYSACTYMKSHVQTPPLARKWISTYPRLYTTHLRCFLSWSSMRRESTSFFISCLKALLLDCRWQMQQCPNWEHIKKTHAIAELLTKFVYQYTICKNSNLHQLNL